MATLHADGEAPSAGAGASARHQSLLFPSLCSKLRREGCLHVLDVGPAFPETVKFFSSYRCRLQFADLYSEPMVINGHEGLEGDDLVQRFTEILAVPDGIRFDLCLLWDFPNYLDDTALKAFSAALRPYLHARSLGHGFAVRTANTEINNQWYGIEESHLFTVRRPATRQTRFFPHAQAILINLLTCFDIDRGMLLPDGRLEVVMDSTV